MTIVQVFQVDASQREQWNDFAVQAPHWARDLGCTSYDLWGIPDAVGQAVSQGQDAPQDERRDGLWGVYRFKRGFGGCVHFYVGAFDYAYAPLLCRLGTRLSSYLQWGTDRVAQLMDKLDAIGSSLLAPRR